MTSARFRVVGMGRRVGAHEPVAMVRSSAFALADHAGVMRAVGLSR